MSLAVVRTLCGAFLLIACAPRESGRRVEVVTGEVVGSVDPRFLSVAIDVAQVVGGVFWDPDGGQSTIGDVRRPPWDFSDPTMRALAAPLAPALLRIGGSAADLTWYATEADAGALPRGYSMVLTRDQWNQAHDFARVAGFDFFFTLNDGPGPREPDGGWNDAQARTLMGWAAQAGQPVAVWELGNEINGYPFIHTDPFFRLSGARYADDVRRARRLVDDLSPRSKLAGPSSAYWPIQGEINPVMADFLEAGGPLVDIVTWHYYPQQSRRCAVATRLAGPEVLLSPGALDEGRKWAAVVDQASARSAPQAQVWLGESGNAQCGGEPGVSDSFVSTLWWLDELGAMARRGHQVVVRQTLSGSDYGLIDEATRAPNPDYWASVLWKRLMGTRVLKVRSDDPFVRAWAHCATSGPSATLLLINLATDAVEVPVSGATRVFRATAPTLESRTVWLNGVALALLADGSLPSLEGVSASSTVVLPPRSWAFVTFSELNACR